MRLRQSGFRSKALVLFGGAVCVFAVFAAASSLVGGRAAQVAQTSKPITASVSAQSPVQSYEGVITDTHCNAKHSPAIGLTASDCTRTCIHSGARFALVDGDAIYTLQGEGQSLKKLAGERVKITGTLSGNQISVVSVTAE